MISTAALSAGLTPSICHYQSPTYWPFTLAQFTEIDLLVDFDIVWLTVFATSWEKVLETDTFEENPSNSKPDSTEIVTDDPIVSVVS